MLSDDIYARRSPSTASQHLSAGFSDENHDPMLYRPKDSRSTLQSSITPQNTSLLTRSTPLSTLNPAILNRSQPPPTLQFTIPTLSPGSFPTFDLSFSAPVTPTPSQHPSSGLRTPATPHQTSPTSDALLQQFKTGLIQRQNSVKNTWELRCRECTSWVRTGVSAKIASFDRPGFFATLEAHMAGKDCGGARSSVAREASRVRAYHFPPQPPLFRGTAAAGPLPRSSSPAVSDVIFFSAPSALHHPPLEPRVLQHHLP
ncbi:hypothetical protein HGRIS_004977 [Hohenbuehelia grisea]|uniref:Uncharacterized protein n=1 Tax=Hohenbuehelia grisea TaxID=104357 RepID=A0ABR3JDJ8_9AGAR